MLTGYEQARSIVAALAGDFAAADHIRLVLPETGVCSISGSAAVSDTSPGCCGGPPPAEVEACCMADAKAKVAEKAGCGCGVAA
jgi:hypothetical protein